MELSNNRITQPGSPRASPLTGITTTALKPLRVNHPRRGRQIASHGEGGRSHLVDLSPVNASTAPGPGLCAASSRDPTTGADTTYPHAPTFKVRPTRNRRKSPPRSTTDPTGAQHPCSRLWWALPLTGRGDSGTLGRGRYEGRMVLVVRCSASWGIEESKTCSLLFATGLTGGCPRHSRRSGNARSCGRASGTSSGTRGVKRAHNADMPLPPDPVTQPNQQ